MKTRKGSLEQKRENFWSLTGEANKRMKGQRSNSIRNLYEVLYPSQNQKFELFVPKCLPSNSRTYHGGSWCLSNCHIQKLKKWWMNLFKMLDFQRTHFLKKRPWKCATFFAQSICADKSFESDHQIPSQHPIWGFLTVITNFFESLKSKGRWLFRNNKSSFENVLVSGTKEASFWK